MAKELVRVWRWHGFTLKVLVEPKPTYSDPMTVVDAKLCDADQCVGSFSQTTAGNDPSGDHIVADLLYSLAGIPEGPNAADVERQRESTMSDDELVLQRHFTLSDSGAAG
jgi:hypothetical protein